MARFAVRRRPLVGATVAAMLAGLWLPAAVLPSASAATVGGFEIDGNAVDNGGLDWSDVSTAPAAKDNSPETTVLSASSKEDNLPSTWSSKGGSPGKTDLVNVWGYAHNTTDSYVDLAFSRVGQTGTGGFYLELDKSPDVTNTHGVRVPDRSDGDVRFQVKQTGVATLSLTDAATWAWSNGAHTAGAWTTVPGFVAGSADGFDYAVNTVAVTPPGGTSSPVNGFVEISFDLTTILGLHPDCPGGFGTVNLRAFTGNSDKDLEDYVTGFQMPTGTTCSTLTILKKTAGGDAPGSALGGATFRITPNPVPNGDGDHLDVTDDGDGDADSTAGTVLIDPAVAGTYSVQEIGAPDGYQIDNPDAVTDSSAPSAGAADPVTFTDTAIPAALSLHKAVDATVAQYKDTLTYTLDATVGGVDQHAVVVTDVVPDGVTYVDGSATCTDRGDCTPSYDDGTRTVSVALGDVAAGATRHVEFKATVDKPEPAADGSIPGRTVTNVGSVASTETPATASNPVSTDIGAVLGVTVTRRPPSAGGPGAGRTPQSSPELPFSGNRVPPAIALALSLVLVCGGGLLMVGAPQTGRRGTSRPIA
jgi:uncharacterized repeat protein (TIGR01451 family)